MKTYTLEQFLFHGINSNLTMSNYEHIVFNVNCLAQLKNKNISDEKIFNLPISHGGNLHNFAKEISLAMSLSEAENDEVCFDCYNYEYENGYIENEFDSYVVIRSNPKAIAHFEKLKEQKINDYLAKINQLLDNEENKNDVLEKLLVMYPSVKEELKRLL